MPLALRRLFWLCAVLFLVSPAPAQTSPAPSFSTVVVFGDSLSDTGNIARLVQNANPLGIRYPADNPALGFDYTDGRFTDGADTQPPAQAYFGVWIEQLAASFPARPTVKDSLDGGTNYAFGDATTGAGTTMESADGINITLDNMGQQVADYLANVGSKSASAPNAQTLFVLWGGANDLYNAAAANTDLSAATSTAISNELALVQQLVSAGATNFMIPNLPPLGGVPSYATNPNAAALNAAAAGFAQGLAQGITTLEASLKAQGVTITVYQPDIFSLFGKFATSPMSVGLGNVTDKAQGITGSPDTYLIWDGLHPTTTGHHFAAATAANLLTPLVASSVALTSPAAAIAGQTVTLSAKVSSTASAAVPSGLVTFFNGSTAIGSAALSGGSGSASVAIPAGSGAVYNLSAVYAGDTTFNVSASSVQPLTLLAAVVATTTTLTTSNPNPGTGSSVTFTATVTPAVSTYGQPTGTVTFLNGATALGTGTLTNGVATFSTSSLALGTASITASYAASGLFGGSTSGVVTETVATPGFTATLNPASLTIKAGSSGTTSLGTDSTGGFSGTLTPTCGTLPAHMSCSFAVQTAPEPVGQSAWTLTVATNATTAALDLPQRPGEWRAPAVFSATLMFAGTLLWGFRRRLRSARGLWTLVLALTVSVGAVVGLAGCGSSSNNTPTGTYTVPVIVTPASGSSVAAQTVNLSVTVQ